MFYVYSFYILEMNRKKTIAYSTQKLQIIKKRKNKQATWDVLQLLGVGKAIKNSRVSK